MKHQRGKNSWLLPEITFFSRLLDFDQLKVQSKKKFLLLFSQVLISFEKIYRCTVILSALELTIWHDFPFFFSLFFFLSFEGLARSMEVPRLGVELELLLLAYTTATATRIWAASVTYAIHGNTGSLTQWVNPGIETVLMGDSQICFRQATTGTPEFHFLSALKNAKRI